MNAGPTSIQSKISFMLLMNEIRPGLLTLIEQPSGSWAFKQPDFIRLSGAMGLILGFAKIFREILPKALRKDLSGNDYRTVQNYVMDCNGFFYGDVARAQVTHSHLDGILLPRPSEGNTPSIELQDA